MFKTKIKIFTLALIVFQSVPSFSISIIGNGIILDLNNGVKMNLVQNYSQSFQVSGEDGIKLTDPTRFFHLNSPTPLTESIFVYRLQKFQSQLTDLSREDFRNHFLYHPKTSWQEIETNDPCVEIFTNNSTANVNYIASWGSGKGLQVLGTPTAYSKQSVMNMLQSMVLGEGACSWK
ncbi:MAG: hypothetical protein ACK5P5_02530 [Pseudobdellovibrionaceae bacterium]